MKDPDEPQAGEWVAAEIARLRALSYEDLVTGEGQPAHQEMLTAADRQLILETQIFWDDGKKRNLRVIVDVWDPAKRVSIGSIASDDFIRAPDGSFIGE
jgi:hypothetical protein